MRDLRAAQGPAAPGEPITFFALVRGALAIMGLVLVAVGAAGCLQLFFTAHAFVKNPQENEAVLAAWRTALGLADAHVELAGQQVPIAGPLTVTMLFFGFVMLVFLLGRILKAGLTLLSWVREDRKKDPPPPSPQLPSGPLADDPR